MPMTKTKKIIIGLSISLLLLIIGWSAFNWGIHSAYDKISPSIESFADEFYARYNDQDYAHIYSNLTNQNYKDVNGFDDLFSLLLEAQQGVGQYQEREMYSWRYRWEGEDTYFYIEYDVTYEHGTTNENFLLKKENGSWLIESYEFE